ncbi:MAG: VWA domain-containing protein [Vicinamibacterales bacterium]
MDTVRIGALLAAATQVVSPQAPPFRSGAHILEVDVRVTDRSGRFPTDLRPHDFEVTEDGVPHQVQTLFLVGVPGATANVGSPRPAPQVWIFVFDDRNLQASGLKRAKSAVETFVRRRLPRNDLAAVVYHDRLVNNRITADREEVVAALDGVQLPGDAGDSSGGAGVWASKLLSERGARSTLGTLSALATGLRQIPGPKTIVLFSDGFPLKDVDGALRTVVQKTNQAGARIYSIDTRGLAGEPTDTLNSLAWDTDGLMLFNANNLTRALAEVEADANVYYVIGYQPLNTKYDGEFRRIQVRVKGAGMRVRARRGYYAVDPTAMLHGAFGKPPRQ